MSINRIMKKKYNEKGIKNFFNKWFYGRFFCSLKSEKFHLKKYLTFQELERDIIDYIKFYNEDRPQKKLGCLSPIEFRNKNLLKQII